MASVQALLTVSVLLFQLGKLESTQLLDRGCIPPAYGTRVVGGQDAARSPWMAYLIRNNAFACGGSLITHPNIRPICILLNPNLRATINRIQEFVLTGWGQTSPFYPVMPTRLQHMRVTRYNYPLCYNQVEKICASNPSKFACSGDSGSPLGAHVMYNVTKIFAQFGVASTVTSCLGYGIYTDVFHHTPWILQVIRLYRN
ncbi:hypothetical protein M5D96_008323 [Drosophila gunungcola]|uniref:Peptidase S1 domain-containing protein n=1 Tax=Drosophila gunungcola TaxID=103775 RepID=A0A9P9YK06_9MUSC|nr:hypothetical protein M5D96_008323 [Drosophila gunungcola]